jgi:hypothetical protein
MFGAVSAFKAMKVARPDAKPDDPLFAEQHREGIKELFKLAGLREDSEGRTRDAKSRRQTGISLRLELGPNPDYRDIAKWARTSPAMVLLLRSDAPTAERRAHCWFQEEHERIKAGRRKNG